MANPNLILPGQEVLIPTTRKKSPAADAPAPALVTGRARARRHDRGDSTSSSEARALTRLPASTQGCRPTTSPPRTGSSTDGLHRHTSLSRRSRLCRRGSGGSASYVVKSGDRLGDIAAKHGTNISALADLNGLSDINLIRSGQKLAVPGGSNWVCPVDGGRYFNDWGFPEAALAFTRATTSSPRGHPGEGPGLGHGRAHRGDRRRAPVQFVWK